MPRLNIVTECCACGEPSEGRYCPACIEERNQYSGVVRRTEDEEWSGSSSAATAIDAR
jgi:hypothetical protein